MTDNCQLQSTSELEFRLDGLEKHALLIESLLEASNLTSASTQPVHAQTSRLPDNKTDALVSSLQIEKILLRTIEEKEKRIAELSSK
ncbi:hypothetical protein BATDEDRAFT_85555 [Batrachochytrium dendrobatidis JAM81]|uniref:Uncharacterized protein n=1 Tax=Batrachochytrium dendrobatidis (strain JAM81 / FGSC 10211) TaxID=684364 RepID=F4NT55_BATDJ|nr:uncharacterized protein BATDEDRAFT_85555 [Batrachochytrium dendrobatidis JAM81]EGF83882.1 hypothetical protein BATDEDRAFT_85555 [Batrachochytrium dendrobatidis JAM81]|eukprot:XP_006676261.1 hypothetical protein BATDEDRAFT_85555 [Batrachochytrium dendrobatidis JAM81]